MVFTETQKLKEIVLGFCNDWSCFFINLFVEGINKQLELSQNPI